MTALTGNTEDKTSKNVAFVTFFATLLAIISMVGIDIYVPAFDEIQTDFNTTAAMVGISIPAYFAGTLVIQLIYGPVSDFIGRKPVLLFSLILFSLGTVGCIFAVSIEMFLVARFVQAFGVCAAAVLWQPIVTDSFPGDDSKIKSVFGFVMIFVGVSPALAPLFGGWITETFGWRAIFVFLLIMAIALLVLTLTTFTETLDPERRKGARPLSVLSSLGKLAKAPIFYVYAISVGLTVGAYMSYLTIAPFALAELSYSPVQIGMHFIPLAMLFGIGGAAGKIASGKLSEKLVLQLAALLMLAAAIYFRISLIRSDSLTIYSYLIPFAFLVFSFGIIIPMGSAMAIQHFNSISGTCSSGMNFVTSVAAFASTLIASLLYADHQHHSMTGVMLVNAALVFLVLFFLRKDSTNDT